MLRLGGGVVHPSDADSQPAWHGPYTHTMGLDIYVGTLTRYYVGDWMTTVQQAFPDQSQTVFDDPPPYDPAFQDDVRAAIARWSSQLAQGLNLESISREDPAAPYFTDKPAWDGYGGLVLWAAYDDQNIAPEHRCATVTVDSWSREPVLQRYATPPSGLRYPQLLRGIELWLPISRETVFKTPDPAGKQRMFGSCNTLLAELNLLNQRTWKADTATRDRWRQEGLEHGSSLEAAARFGWSVMHSLATEAVQHQLPIILDY